MAGTIIGRGFEENRKGISDEELELHFRQRILNPLKHRGYLPMFQPWNDGWLLHLYTIEGKHVTTIGGTTLNDCIDKGKKYG